MIDEKENKSNLSRRKFLLSTGAAAAGVIAAGALAGCGTTKEEETKPTKAGAAAALPWKFQKLDVEKVRKAGYDSYYAKDPKTGDKGFQGGCCYGAVNALVANLKEAVGAPWDTFPTEVFKYGEGGAIGWGTLCGSLNGALAVINLVAKDSDDMKKMGNELMGWYTGNAFPSSKHDSYAKFKGQPTSVSKSPLCHASVSVWCDASGKKVSTPDRLDRCAKVTGDVAAYTAEMLNKYMEGSFTAAFKPGAEYASCISCHNGKTSALDNEQGKMNCVECHDDHNANKQSTVNTKKKK